MLAALALADGAIGQNGIAVAACIYPVSLRTVDPGAWERQRPWTHRADVPIYPASVMKLFLLAVLADLRAKGWLGADAEDDRAARAMIRESSNEATAYLMGRVTGAFDGDCLGSAALEDWLKRRTLVQDWFRSTGTADYAGVQLLHATYQDSPYGRAQQARTPANANRLTAAAGARLIHDIARGASAGSAWMMDLLDREFQRHPNFNDPEGDQVRGFLTEGLPASVRVWSKAGHTSQTRHDLLYAEAPEGLAYVLSVMTEGRWSSANETFLPAFARAFHDAACRLRSDTTQAQENTTTGGKT